MEKSYLGKCYASYKKPGRDTLIIWIAGLSILLKLQRSLYLMSSNQITLLLYFIR